MSGATIDRQVELLAMAATCKVDSKIWFEGERNGYTVQARSARYLVCTKPFNAQRTTLYTIVDLDERVRGTENLIFGAGFETKRQCLKAILRLSGRGQGLGVFPTEVSHRNRVKLNITKLEQA